MAADNHSVQFGGRPLGQHRHICAFFNSVDEEQMVLGPFIKDGFERGDKAFHLVDPALRQQYLKSLAALGVDVQGAMARGQLEVVPWQDCYVREGRFDQDAMVVLLEDMLRSSAAAGYPLTRLLAHMEWALLDKPGVEDLLEYETRLNYMLPKYDDPVICTYDLTKFGASTAMDILRTHPVIIIGGVVQENPFFVPPDQFLLEIRERRAARQRSGMVV